MLNEKAPEAVWGDDSGQNVWQATILYQEKCENSIICLSPDRFEAERFLKALDHSAAEFTFQTFDDDKARKNPQLACVLHGTLDKHWDTLCRLNDKGAGVFVTINETDGNGRKKENIIRVRAIWQEDDGEGKPLPIEPHIVVESSPGKYHRYILVDGCPLDAFRGFQERMVESYGSDPNAADISRVLRLPGFFHQKDRANPHMVRMVEEGVKCN